MTLARAIRLLEKEYKKAKCLEEWIHNPIAYALYQVWKMADREGYSMAEKKTENPKCSECSHTLKKRCRFGATIHCTLDGSMMDVTEIVEQDGRTLFCPLLKVGK